MWREGGSKLFKEWWFLKQNTNIIGRLIEFSQLLCHHSNHTWWLHTGNICFFQGLKCRFFFFGKKKCSRSTRILCLKEKLVLFCFKYCDGEKRCRCFAHCIGRVSYMAICYLQQERRESRTIAHWLTRKKKKSWQLLLFFIYFNHLHLGVMDLKQPSIRLNSSYWLTVFSLVRSKSYS